MVVVHHDFKKTDKTLDLDAEDLKMGCKPDDVWRVYTCDRCGSNVLFIDGTDTQIWVEHFNKVTPCQTTIH